MNVICECEQKVIVEMSAEEFHEYKKALRDQRMLRAIETLIDDPSRVDKTTISAPVEPPDEVVDGCAHSIEVVEHTLWKGVKAVLQRCEACDKQRHVQTASPFLTQNWHTVIQGPAPRKVQPPLESSATVGWREKQKHTFASLREVVKGGTDTLLNIVDKMVGLGYKEKAVHKYLREPEKWGAKKYNDKYILITKTNPAASDAQKKIHKEQKDLPSWRQLVVEVLEKRGEPLSTDEIYNRLKDSERCKRDSDARRHLVIAFASMKKDIYRVSKGVYGLRKWVEAPKSPSAAPQQPVTSSPAVHTHPCGNPECGLRISNDRKYCPQCQGLLDRLPGRTERMMQIHKWQQLQKK